MEITELDRSFRDIHRWHRKALETRLNQTGIFRAQHQILMYVSKHPQSSQKNIAEEFKISPPAVGVSLKKLEKGGYLRRIVDESDNRFHQVTLTEKGMQIVADSERIFQQTMQEMYQGLQDEELEALQSYFIRIRDNLKKICEEEQRKEGM